MAGGKQNTKKKPSSSLSQDTDASVNQTTITPTKKQKRDAGNNDQHGITDNNQTSLNEDMLSGGSITNNNILGDDNVLSTSNASIATDIESSNNTTTIMVNGSAPVGTPADIDITIEQKLPTKEQLAVSTYQINMFLHLFLCCLIFHRVHCVFFKI
jgi:hypothetical protein